MEYVEGGDLYTKLLKQGKLDESLARKLFQQLITAVDFCHGRGVCHRDLKLENILLDPKGENLKICDFGLATFLGKQVTNYDTNLLLYTTCGAFAYMAPEILRGEGYDGKKADLWSCGVILFTLLAGFPPFQDENRIRMLWKIRVCKYEFPLGFPKEVEDLIKKLLVKNPNERIMISDIMRNPWFKKGLLSSNECDYYNNSSSSNECDYYQMNAFDFMSSMASGLDLSNLFDTQKRKVGSIFVTKCSRLDVVAKVEEMAEELKYEVRKEECRVVLRGRAVVAVEVFEVSPEVRVVEFSRRGGDCGEYWRLMEEEVRPSMEGVVWKWQGDWFIERKNGGGNGSFLRLKWCKIL